MWFGPIATKNVHNKTRNFHDQVATRTSPNARLKQALAQHSVHGSCSGTEKATYYHSTAEADVRASEEKRSIKLHKNDKLY